MSAALSEGALSREEFSALLGSVAKGGTGANPSDGPRAVGLGELTGARAELGRVASQFADEFGRSLSTLHQTAIGLRLSHWEEITLRQFSAAMLQSDRIAKFELGTRGADAYLLMSRPMVFGWMMLAFGAGPECGDYPLPSRLYTRIEERFIRRCAREVADCLRTALGNKIDGQSRLVLESPRALLAHAKRSYLIAGFDASGLGNMAGMKLALPLSLLEESADGQQLVLPPSAHLESEVLDMPIEMRVELGFADMTLKTVALLAIGDELALQRSSSEGLTIRVEGAPKYRAESGSLGHRLAVRITEVL